MRIGKDVNLVKPGKRAFVVSMHFGVRDISMQGGSVQGACVHGASVEDLGVRDISTQDVEILLI